MSPWWFFALTLALEFPVVWFFYRDRWKNMLVPFFLLNLFTWPLLHYLLMTTHLSLNLMEAGVTLVEMTGYRFLMADSWPRSFAVSLAANGFSYGAGLLIIHYLL